ncbi:MAG: DUF6596 domain-containing protein [Pseudomonadota bacterium]
MRETPEIDDARAQAEHVARTSYGKLIAVLAKQSGDIAAAEDAIADAFAKALEVWPRDGTPTSPEAWLLTVAKNKHRDVAKSAAVRTAAGSLNDEEFTMPQMTTATANSASAIIPDERLSLMFACAHPAIDEHIHTPLMLQTVLGLEANDIASAYLVPGATLAQRLVRAKRKIRDARIPFIIPQADEIAPRLESVLEAIYGAYSLSWQEAAKSDITSDLASEALYLAHVVSDLLPREPEGLGLATLIAYSLARRQARLDHAGILVPIDQQITDLWDLLLIKRADKLLARASSQKRPGRFQIEAAIQAVHCDRARTGKTDWQAIAALYDGLLSLAPTMGSAVARASAVGQAYGAPAGFNALATIDRSDAESFQPYWATLAFLHKLAGDAAKAQEAYNKAISLCTDIPTRRWLEKAKKTGL